MITTHIGAPEGRNKKVRMMNQLYTLQVPAKINLALKIVGRDEEGYHKLSMLNAQVALYDELEIELINEKRFSLTVVDKVEVENITDNNTVLKAAKLYDDAFGLPCGLKIKLKKHIPIGTGLGGGSADAACLLKFLAKEFACNDNEKLYQIAAQIGADVPYAMDGGVAILEGRGEIIKPLRDIHVLDGVSCALLVPEERINTAKAYGLYRSLYPEIPAKDVLPTPKDDYDEILSLVTNDLAEPARKLSPQVDEVLSLFQNDPELLVSLTGSGSAMFVLPKKKDAPFLEQLQKRLDLAKINFLQIIPTTILAYC